MSKRNKLKKIIDTSRQWKEPQRLPFHWAYVIYFGLALTCSLWQHADPILTLSLLALLFPVGALAYIPYKYFSSNKRFVGQLIFIVFAALWCLLRIKEKVPVDKILVEGLCIAAFCFIMAQRRNDYDYLFFVSVFLFLYGALLPRKIFVVAFCGAAILCALLFYSTRLKLIASQLDLENPAKIFSRSWPQYGIHIILTLTISYYIFSIIPDQEREGEGLFVSSFRTENTSVLPPAFRNWFAQGEVKKSPRGDMTVKNGSPTNVGKSGTPIKMKNDRRMSVPGDGGSGTPGEELIFRVKSPVKLYWVAQIYDNYNGSKWTFSSKVKANKIKKISELNQNVTHYEIETNFIIEKWLGPKLYFAYRPTAISVFRGNASYYSYQSSPFNVVLTEKEYPPLPCLYNVSTVLYIPSMDEKKRVECDWNGFWVDSLNPLHYTKLPRSKISWRTKRLVKMLVRNIRDPYKKALVLRDYLRNNFKYLQYSRPVPRGKETVDYFLFQLHEGHCEYFASALTVMARLAGLPARVVTGFSPGNYNALNKYFEVHAYHAHAWTQIFIPGMGWLTLDATPPGAVESRTTPFGIGSMRDPFGDSWRVTPPEITSETISYIRNKYYEKLEADRRSGKFNTYEELFIATAQAQYMASEKLKDYLNRFKDFREQGIHNLKGVFARLKERMAHASAWLRDAFDELLELLQKRWFVLITISGIIVAVILEIMILKRYLNRQYLLRKCRKFYAKAKESYPDNPDNCVKMCYLMTRTLLNLGGFPRPRNTELLEYGRLLAAVDTGLHKSVIVIFFMFYKLEYSADSVSEEEADETFERLERIRKYIYTLINEESEIIDEKSIKADYV
ncbi:MAG: transglutaminase-like domain-containing protein [Victivallaceae bacterium]|nr:transglutaminase-like domain-containing protein [Victivallaceae bacterium]